MTFTTPRAPSGSSHGFVAHPDSVRNHASQKSSKIHGQRRTFVNQGQPIIEIGKGTSNIKFDVKALDPLIIKTISRMENGDRMEFRNRGTKLKYRHTFEQDGSLRQDHKLGFAHFVIIRGFKKRGGN